MKLKPVMVGETAAGRQILIDWDYLTAQKIDGQRYEHRGGYCPRYRWCRNGYSRNEYACQYIQEKTGRHDSGSYLFNGSYRRLCI